MSVNFLYMGQCMALSTLRVKFQIDICLYKAHIWKVDQFRLNFLQVFVVLLPSYLFTRHLL